MIIKEINEGAKIVYEVNGTSICFDDDLTINLEKRQKNHPVHIDVCSDKDGALVIGAESGEYYVAQIDIPAKEYEETEPIAVGIEHIEATTSVAKPLDTEKVSLTLWALVNRANTTTQGGSEDE